jgi:hypothetical protein
MAKTKRLPQQVVKVKNYGNEEINRLAVAQQALSGMTEEERHRALRWFKGLYGKEWPSDSY